LALATSALIYFTQVVITGEMGQLHWRLAPKPLTGEEPMWYLCFQTCKNSGTPDQNLVDSGQEFADAAISGPRYPLLAMEGINEPIMNLRFQ
jgi:hypothetical protein